MTINFQPFLFTDKMFALCMNLLLMDVNSIRFVVSFVHGGINMGNYFSDFRI